MTFDPLTFQDKVVVVTGGRDGIGRAIVGRLLALGAQVAALDVKPPDGIEEPRLLEIACDVTSPGSVGEAVLLTVERFGGIDGVVQCAGVTADGVLWKMTEEQWQTVIDVNLTGAFHVLRACVPHLRARGGGSVVNVTSINGFRGKFGQSNYAASKGGLVSLTKTAAREVGMFDIRVNAVAPGMVRTAMTETLPPEIIERAVEETALKRICRPEDVAAAVVFLLSDEASHITGTTLRVDAGQCM